MPFKRKIDFLGLILGHSDDSIGSHVSSNRCERFAFHSSQHPIHMTVHNLMVIVFGFRDEKISY